MDYQNDSKLPNSGRKSEILCIKHFNTFNKYDCAINADIHFLNSKFPTEVDFALPFWLDKILPTNSFNSVSGLK